MSADKDAKRTAATTHSKAAAHVPMSSTVSFAFYTGLGASEPLINRLTALISGRFMHVEIVFPAAGASGAAGEHLACGVWAGEKTFMRKKRFGKSCWVWKSISVTEAQKEAMRKFCALQARRKVPFSRMAMMRAVTPFPRATDGRTWFCSELCVAAMQAGGLLLDEVAAACTPSDVHELLLSLRAYSSASPVVEDRIAANKLRCGSKWFRRAGGGR